MYESPTTLEEICLNCVCVNIINYMNASEDLREPGWWNIANMSGTLNLSSFRFRDPDLFLINEMSERLLNKFVVNEVLIDPVLLLFTGKNTQLRSVKFKNSLVTQVGMKILREHKIVDLECVDLKHISIAEVIGCLSEWSINNMVNLSFSRCSFLDTSRFRLMVKIVNFKSLKSLSLAFTEINQEIFTMICEDLKLLEKLDISGTKVTDLSPLTELPNILALTLIDLPQITNVIPTLQEVNLRYLDISLNEQKAERYEHFNPLMLLRCQYILPNLVSLDLSGWKDAIFSDVLISFVEAHQNLTFLGMALNTASLEPALCESKLVIAGLGTEEQIKLCLRKYSDRHTYVQKALYYLFQLTNGYKIARPDIFSLVLPVMEAHPNKFGVQMAATACLYNLTRSDLSKHIHPTPLSKGVELTLRAMSNFPREFQLQKNSLLILCSDRILQDVTFNRFLCAKLALDALCFFHDVNMNRMAVAICGILAAKVTTEETSLLGARKEYMQKLLAMVHSRVESVVSDITLKFTLSTLWNLTDESVPTCTVFLDEGGAFLFLNVLKTFKNDSGIENKVLGLLNNISEVPHLRQHLMLDSLMDEVVLLLKSENIDVSYFAAGIVAHLASDGDDKWTIKTHSREEMLEELLNVVSEWKDPDNEMVAYRSFRPFYPLLKVDMDYQIQLWAVWAIHHVCSNNPKRYCPMVYEESGHLLLQDLVASTNSHQKIVALCSKVLDTLELNYT